jgi:pimeloyl-ACP methyl ester carboxylesterase
MRILMAAVLAALSIRRCEPEPDQQSALQRFGRVIESLPPKGQGPIRIETLDKNQDPPVFVMRGSPHGDAKIVFLHGMCGHGMGYAQSFQWSAARRGLLIAPQADVKCGTGPWAKWSGDVAALDARIESAFRALGHEGPLSDVLVIGYSQGATRAEALARKWPERYTRMILMGAPKATSPNGLSKLRGAVMMAGSRDRQDQMKAGARALNAAGIPATFQIIPEATHGAMGPTPELTMSQAFDWLWENQKPAKAAAGTAASAAPGSAG